VTRLTLELDSRDTRPAPYRATANGDSLTISLGRSICGAHGRASVIGYVGARNRCENASRDA
jgi:hypothetical protein